jgi:phosphohistidine phosphatase
MELMIVRHAIAEERDSEKWADDRGRPLTKGGIRRFQTVARVLSGLWDAPEVVLSSPLARAWQTAEILRKEAGWPKPEEFPALEPGRDPAEAIAAMKKRAVAERVAFVGHEPFLHEFLSLVLSGTAEGIALEMKKGGAALVGFEGPIKAGAGDLLWLLPPRILRAAAGK